MTFEPVKMAGIGVKVFADMADAAMGVKSICVHADNAGGFLTTMLECMQSECCHHRSFRRTVDTKDCTFIMKAVGKGRHGGMVMISASFTGSHPE